MSIEIEFKWEANSPRAFVNFQKALKQTGAQISRSQHWQITDVYVDTPARDFEKEQIAFRVRHINHTWEATFKTRTELVNGKAVRREETCALPGVKNLPQALAFLQRKKNWKGLNISALVPLFTLKNRRKTQLVTCPRMQAEVAFDTCEILVCGRRVHFKEIEMELKKGPQTAFEKFGKNLQIDLPKARVSKVKTALTLFNLWGEK